MPAAIWMLAATTALTLLTPQASSFRFHLSSDDLDPLTPSSSLTSHSSQSESHPEYGARSHKSSNRSKRISQLSCQCCSNSFNSHCCLQCMRSVGKRSGVPIERPEDKEPHRISLGPLEQEQERAQEDFYLYPVDDHDDDSQYFPLVDGDEDDNISPDDMASQSRSCVCCLYQVRRNPQAEEWPCCRRCSSRR